MTEYNYIKSCAFYGTAEETGLDRDKFVQNYDEGDTISYAFVAPNFIHSKTQSQTQEFSGLGLSIVRVETDDQITFHVGCLLVNNDKHYFETPALTTLVEANDVLEPLIGWCSVGDSGFIELDEHGLNSFIALMRSKESVIYSDWFVKNRLNVFVNSFDVGNHRLYEHFRHKDVNIRELDLGRRDDRELPSGMDESGYKYFVGVTKVQDDPDKFSFSILKQLDDGDKVILMSEEIADQFDIDSQYIDDEGRMGDFDLPQAVSFLEYVYAVEDGSLCRIKYCEAQGKFRRAMDFLYPLEEGDMECGLPEKYIEYEKLLSGEVDLSHPNQWDFVGPNRSEAVICFSREDKDGEGASSFAIITQVMDPLSPETASYFLELVQFAPDEGGFVYKIEQTADTFIQDYCLPASLIYSDKHTGPYSADLLPEVLNLASFDKDLSSLHYAMSNTLEPLFVLMDVETLRGTGYDDAQLQAENCLKFIEAFPFGKPLLSGGERYSVGQVNVREKSPDHKVTNEENSDLFRLAIKRIEQDNSADMYFFNFLDDPEQASALDDVEACGRLEEALMQVAFGSGSEYVGAILTPDQDGFRGPLNKEQMAYVYFMCKLISEYAYIERIGMQAAFLADLADEERYEAVVNSRSFEFGEPRGQVFNWPPSP